MFVFQELLLQAHLVEVEKEKAERRVFNALDAKFPSLSKAPTEVCRYIECSISSSICCICWCFCLYVKTTAKKKKKNPDVSFITAGFVSYADFFCVKRKFQTNFCIAVIH